MSAATDKCREYLAINKELGEVRKRARELKKKSDELEKEIKAYLVKNEMDSVCLPEGEILLYEKKIPQTFKKDSIVEKLTEELNDSRKAELITERILTNKKFVMEDKIRCVLKK